MPGRQPTPLGSYGKITTVEVKPKLYEARTRYKDPDGVLRRVKRQAASRSAAETALKTALTERRHTAGASLSGSTKLHEAGEMWLANRHDEVQEEDLAPRTYDTYHSAWKLHVAPALGELRLRELNTSACEAWLLALRKRKSAEMCRTARTVLSGILGYSARMGAIATNPVRDTSRIRGVRTRKPRALTATERRQWLEWLDTHAAHDPKKPPPVRTVEQEQALVKSRALGDISRMLLATGCRIGECMALSWDDIDLDAGTAAIRWHLVRVNGGGLVRMEGAKSDAGDRVLRLPSWAVDMLMRRRVDSLGGDPVFPDENEQWRDPNLVSRWIRWSRDAAGFPWLTSHRFRQTVISALDTAGLSTREVADQAGHSQVSQTHSYMQRGVASERAAAALEDLL